MLRTYPSGRVPTGATQALDMLKQGYGILLVAHAGKGVGGLNLVFKPGCALMKKNDISMSHVLFILVELCSGLLMLFFPEVGVYFQDWNEWAISVVGVQLRIKDHWDVDGNGVIVRIASNTLLP
jgi:hypothetical protein